MASKEVMRLTRDMSLIKAHLLPRAPPKFSGKDLVKSFFGSLLVGLTFTFKGLLFEISFGLTNFHISLIILSTIIILTLEIYYIAYAKVKDKNHRGFGQFWLKRILTFYSVAILTTFILVFIYGLTTILDPGLIWKLIIAVSFPCAIGASLGDLLERY